MIAIGGQYFNTVGYYFNAIDSLFKTSAESSFTSVLRVGMPVYSSVAAQAQVYTSINIPKQPTYTGVGVG
jgi:hypothetical protein